MSNEVEGGFSNIFNFGFASGVIYDSEKDEYLFFGPGDQERIRMCQYLSGNKDKIAVSFNGINFDSFLLLGNDRILDGKCVASSDGNYEWMEIDVYLEIHMRISEKDTYTETLEDIKKNRGKWQKGTFSLDGIASATIHQQKNGKGEDGPRLIKENKLAELFQYNFRDVQLLKNVYIFIKTYRYCVTGSYDIVKFE